ncbi:MAG: hypothetical protein SFW67_35460 [Myxococcaceae bacterium]|nr:hypothetical protein [Myxococcaceae bacterium]
MRRRNANVRNVPTRQPTPAAARALRRADNRRARRGQTNASSDS